EVALDPRLARVDHRAHPRQRQPGHQQVEQHEDQRQPEDLGREGREIELRHDAGAVFAGLPPAQNANRIMNAISRPKRPVASASAKPRNAHVVTCAEGLRASELMSEPNTLPMPMPAPTSAMQARPAPIILADARSMEWVLSQGFSEGGSRRAG